jgi:cell division septal protein FtsQ
MNFGQKSSRSRNRRVSNVRQRRQQHLLDVKVRSRRATQHRVRKAMSVLARVILVAALCAAGYAGVCEAGRRLLFENSDFQLKTIELQTDGTLQREQVLKAVDLHEGENIFKVNLAQVHDRIRARFTFVSWNESRSRGSPVKRKFPIRLRQMLLFWWTRVAF